MKETYIRFMAPVIPGSIDVLMKIIDQKIHHGYERLHLMLSSPGGSVFHGLSVYNYLKGAPIEVHTYNFGERRFHWSSDLLCWLEAVLRAARPLFDSWRSHEFQRKCQHGRVPAP